MFRLIGFLGGTIMFLVLAVKNIPGYQYYYVCAGCGFAVITFVAVFRLLAKYFNGFWKVWINRLQKWISPAVMCFSKYVCMPDYVGSKDKDGK